MRFEAYNKPQAGGSLITAKKQLQKVDHII